MAELHHENIVPNLRNGIYFEVSERPQPRYVPFHWHNSVELVYVLDGHLRFTIDGKPLHVRDGEFAMVHSGAIHDVASGPNHAYILQMPLRALRPYVEHPSHYVFANGRVGTPEYDEVVACMHLMGTVAGQPSLESSFEFELCLLNILRCMFCKLGASRTSPYASDSAKEILAYLHEHVTEPLSVGELAARFGYNPSYLSRMFKQQTGTTLVSYVYQLRVNMLREELLATDEPVAELMAKCGLTNARLARETFQRQFGMLPKDVRKQA